MLIVCEGKKSEPKYFGALWQALRVRTVDVEIVGAGAAPITVVQQAIRRKDSSAQAASVIRLEYDEVWCVFDVEAPKKHPSVRRALAKAKAQGVHVALSNPCFEYWLLPHFDPKGCSFTGCKHVIRELRKHIPSYTKGGDYYSMIADKTITAIRNARHIHKQHQYQPDPVQRNPSTQVYELVEYLQRMAKKQYPT